jgi:hypothetical protein
LAKNLTSETLEIEDHLDLKVTFAVNADIVPMSHRKSIVEYVAFVGDCQKSERLMIRNHCLLNTSTVQRFVLCKENTGSCKVIQGFVTVTRR